MYTDYEMDEMEFAEAESYLNDLISELIPYYQGAELTDYD